ncbi:MAG: hypothetical protein AMS17_09165 [Spirochaetes bacterium DG_61]|nr:MAG: hypothetical protein AMS17_09165 [Spirochaetes bacterium DG_61]
MNLSESLRPECIQIGSSAHTKPELLREIVRLAVKSPTLAGYPFEKIYSALHAREEIGSTGFGNGIAIPHCSLKDVEDFVIGVLIHPEGIDFDAIDKQKTKLFFFIIGPEEKRTRHIQILSSISKFLKTPQTVDQLIREKLPEAVLERILSQLETAEELKEKKGRCLFHVFVQKEELFDEILQIFSAAVEGSIAVIEASNAGYYLHSMPLFSALWSERGKAFHRLILAIVNKELSNDVIRRIHTVAEKLEREPGILIAVQDLFYTSGLIEF